MAIKPELLVINSPEQYQTLAEKRREGQPFFLLEDVNIGDGSMLVPQWLRYSLCGMSLTPGLPFKNGDIYVSLDNMRGRSYVAWTGSRRSGGRSYNYYKHVNPVKKRFECVFRDAFNYAFLKTLGICGANFPYLDLMRTKFDSSLEPPAGTYLSSSYWERYNIFRPFIDVKHIKVPSDGVGCKWEFTAHLLDGLLQGTIESHMEGKDSHGNPYPVFTVDGWLIMYRNDFCHIYKVNEEPKDYGNRWEDGDYKLARLWWNDMCNAAQWGMKNGISHTVIRKARKYKVDELINMAQTETLLRKGNKAGGIL